MKAQHIICSLLALSGITHAATIISSNFDSNTGATALVGGADNTSGAGNTLSVTWTGDENATGSALQSISPGGGFAIVNGSPLYSNNNVAFINHNMNIADRAGARGYSFTFTPASAYDLTSLSLRSGHTSAAANQNQAFDSDLTVSISGGVFSNTQTIDYDTPTPAIRDLNYDLTGTSLSAGVEYTVTITSANMSGGGAYMVYDGITLEGTAVPEPSSSALIGLGGLALLMRRRK
ncbi:MAG: PEP-CTERM sorting domain-containing protein [Akkermansiaceae bacterium]